MINYLGKFFKWCITRYNNNDGNAKLCEAQPSRLGRNHGMNFSIVPANGGYVVSYDTYDEKTDRHNNELHIITHDQDFATAISHVITLEMMRR